MFKFLKDRKKKDNKGFTLVEMVIVIAILAILVGLLAPQYTKYVEKSRKTADASNMDEMVKVVKVYAADPANELKVGSYTIQIPSDKEGTTTITPDPAGNDITGLEKELDSSIPNWTKTVTKSKKWGAEGAAAPIKATVKVNSDGGTSVEYEDGTTFKTYMESSGASTGTAANKDKNGDNTDENTDETK